MKKRILSMLLVLVMMFSTLPATALAVEGEGETGTEVVASYEMAAGDVVFIPDTVRDDEVVKAYIVNSASALPGTEVTVAISVSKSGSSTTNGKFWECNEDGTVKRVTGIWYSDTKYQYGYHETITALDTEAGTMSTAHAVGHIGGDKCAQGFADACGNSSQSTRYYECANELAIAEDLTIIDLTGNGCTDLAAVKALTDAKKAIINIYAPDGACDTSYNTGNATGTAQVIVVEEIASGNYAVAEPGEVYYINGTAKGANNFTKNAYVIASESKTVGSAVTLFMAKGSTSSDYLTGRFWKANDDGSLTSIRGVTVTSTNGGNGDSKYGYHDAINKITDAGVVILQDGMQHRGSVTNTTAKACCLGFIEACGDSGYASAMPARQLGPYVQYVESTLILDLRRGVEEKIDTLDELKTLASGASNKGGEAGKPVVNTYSADAVYTTKDDYKVVAGNLNAIVIVDGYPEVEYTVTVGEVENGTLSVDTETDLAGTQVTVTAEPAEGYKLEAIYVDGKAISGNTFTITANHEVTAKFVPFVALKEGDVIYVPGYIKGNFGDAYVLTGETPTEKVYVEAGADFPWNSTATDWSKKAYRDSFYYINANGKPVLVNGYYSNSCPLPANTYAVHDTIVTYAAATEEAAAVVTLDHAASHLGTSTCPYEWKYNCGGDSRGFEFAATVTLSDNCAVIDLRDVETPVTTVAELGALADGTANVVNMWGANANVVDAIILLETGAEKFDITVGEVVNGTVTVSAPKAVAGDKITVTATPAEGYKVEAIYVDGVAIEAKITFTVTGDHVVTATFAEAAKLAAGDVVYIADEVRYADRVYTGVVVKSETLTVGDQVTIKPISTTVGETYARLYYTGRFWTATETSFTPDKDIWNTPKNTLGVHDAFVSYDAETNTMVIDDAAGHQFQSDCAYRYGQTTEGNKETCGAIDRGSDSWEPSSVTLAEGVYVLDTRTLAEGETAVTDIAGIQALAANNEVVMNVYCATENEASFIVIIEASPLYAVTVAEAENGTVKVGYESLSEKGYHTELSAPAKARLQVVATPAEGYMVDRWVIDGKTQINGFFTVTGAHVVSATFRLPAIKVGTVENGTVEVDKAAAAIGETVTVTATAAEGYELVSILVDGAAIEGNSFVVAKDHTVTATFQAIVVEPTKYAITVNEAVNGTVTVDKTEAEAGEIVTITATPAEGYEVAEIKVDGIIIEGNTFTVTGAHTVEVNFAAIVVEPTYYTISVGAVENGTVTVDPAKAEAGATVTVTATPAEGYRLMGIKVDGVAITGNTFTVTGNHEVTAEFKTLLTFYGSSANVGDVLDLNFRVTAAEVDFEGGYAILNGPQGEQRVERADWTLSGSGASQRYNIPYKGMYSTMMADEVTVVVYDDNGNQMITAMSDSIRGYTMRALASYASNAKYQKLCVLLVDMLVYGATSQVKFDHNAADPADSLLSDAQRALATVEAKPYESIQEKSHTGNGATATLGSRIELNFTFLKSDVPGAASAKFTFDHAQSSLGAAEVVVPVENFAATGSGASAKWKIALNALVAADGRQAVRCEILDAEGNVLAWSVDTVAGYVARLIGQAASYKWVESMVIFCDSAYGYFCQ